MGANVAAARLRDCVNHVVLWQPMNIGYVILIFFSLFFLYRFSTVLWGLWRNLQGNVLTILSWPPLLLHTARLMCPIF